jgi:iron complex outermembrane receptor protein
MGVRAEETDATQLEAVVVTAPLPQKVSDAARPVTVLTEDELVSRAGNTIGQTLQQEPGMNSRAFGPGVGSPVIRGQAGPRVRVMQNGIGNNDVSALSPDHANSLEPMQADRIEVLRGPATLLYGSCAIGGVVNVIDNRVPSRMRERLMGGAFEQSYNSVSDETASNLKLEGGKDSIAYHVDGFYREQGNTHSPPTSA